MLVDEFLPTYDVSDSVATVVDASVARSWGALLQADLLEVGRRRPLIGVLGTLRILPEMVSHLLHGEAPLKAPTHLRLRHLAEMPPSKGGWVLLDERPCDEIGLGLVGKFWRPVIDYVHVRRDGFRGFDEPGYAKTVYSLSVRAIGEDRTLLTGTMRTATTDEHARRWFRRYWALGVGAGAHLLVSGLLDDVREAAESSPSEKSE